MEANSELQNILNDFFSAYAQRDRSIAFQDWLGDTLKDKLPDLTTGAERALAGEITGAVNWFNQKLHETETATASDLSAEEWLTEQLVESCSTLSPDEAGERLLAMESELIQSNAAMLSMDGVQVREIPRAVADPVGWNKYTLKEKAREIAKQVGMAGLGVAANAAKHKMDGSGSLKLREAVGKALQDGVTDDPEEVKILLAGAIRAAAENGAIANLDEDTPIEVFVSIAGFAVEAAQAIFAAVNGRIKPEKAVEKICKAGIAAYAYYGAEALEGYIQCQFPVIGTVAVELLGGLFDHMKSPEFVNNVYTVFHDMAVAAWDGILQPMPDPIPIPIPESEKPQQS